MSVERVTEKKLSVTIVIPIHNEEAILAQNVREMIKRLKAFRYFSWDMILVENGSKDKTADIAHLLSEEFEEVSVLRSKVASYGKAMQLGFLEAKGDIIVNFDIDFWDCEFIQLATHVMQVKYDIVIASKNLLLSSDQRGFIRKVASYTFRMLLFFLFGLRVSDTHGIKAWRNTPEMQSFFKKSKPSNHTYDTEIIVRAMHAGCLALEIPVSIRETRAQTRSMIKRIPKALKEILSLFLRFRFGVKIK